jgi:hypothetical protein
MNTKGIVAAPIAAIVTSLASLGCCLPLGFLGAGLAGVGFLLNPFRPWLLGFSVVLLAFGCFQQKRAARCGAKRSPLSLTLLVLSAGITVVMIFFPQATATFVTRHLAWNFK